MIKCELSATNGRNGQHSENYICMDTGVRIRLSAIKEFVKGIGGYLEPKLHPLNINFINYNICFPDMESYNNYIIYCKIID